DDEDKDKEPSVGPDRGSKRRRECKEPESASTPSEPVTRSTGRSITGSKSRQASTSESAFTKEPVQTTSQMEEPSHLKFETGAEDQPIVQHSQYPKWFSQPKKPPTLDRDWNKTLPAQAPIPPTPILSQVLQNIPTFALVFHFDDRLRIAQHFKDERMNKAVQVAVQLQSDRLREEAQK
nr:hypothetical protein [Tanacetum cinerariifolium]